MKNITNFSVVAILWFAIWNCGGSGMTPPDPKRVSCEQSCGVVAEKAVKKCTSEKKSTDICKAAGSAAESKCIDECMAQ